MTAGSTTPEVSICIPTYNGEPYLRECLESAIRQTHADFEVLVVDDCSSDDTFRIAEQVSRVDPRIRVVCNNANQGLVGNWNRCISLARGRWIKFLFQDDLLHPDCVQRLLEAARLRQARFVACDRRFLFDTSINDQWRDFYARSRASVCGFVPTDGG